jgi:outer membrane protein assembly factor BamB
MRKHIHVGRPWWRRRTAGRAAPLLLVAVLTALGLMAAPGSASAAALASWPQFGHDPRHTGFNPDETVITRDTVGGLSVDYVAFGPGDPERDAISRSSPAVVGSVAYVGTDAGFLLALPANGCGAATCDPLWTAKLANGAFTTPAVAGGLVFISSTGSLDNGLGTLYAFKAAGCGRPTCRPVWTASVPNFESSPPSRAASSTSSPATAGCSRSRRPAAAARRAVHCGLRTPTRRPRHRRRWATGWCT